jgi:putative methyltransferase (TIGR04325 family)
LSVVDFGGSLATHYLRWRPWLDLLPDVLWHVVEQPHFVHVGQALFAGDSRVSFGELADVRAQAPNAVLLSGVLQYLPDPTATLAELVALSPRAVVIDRTTFSEDHKARLLSQHVPWTLGKSSYPMWLLSRAKIAAVLAARYACAVEFPSDDPPVREAGIRGTYGGGAWWRKDPSVVSSLYDSGIPR